MWTPVNERRDNYPLNTHVSLSLTGPQLALALARAPVGYPAVGWGSAAMGDIVTPWRLLRLKTPNRPRVGVGEETRALVFAGGPSYG